MSRWWRQECSAMFGFVAYYICHPEREPTMSGRRWIYTHKRDCIFLIGLDPSSAKASLGMTVGAIEIKKGHNTKAMTPKVLIFYGSEENK